MSPPPPLRVLHVVLSLVPGGTQRLVIEMARRMRPAVEPSVCCLDAAGEWAREVEEAGIPVDVLGRTPGFHPTLGRALASVAGRRQATVLHCHQYSPFVYGALARLASRRVGVLVTEHGRLSDATPSPRRRAANWLLSRLPQAIVAISHEQRRFMLAEGFAVSRVRVIHNGIDPGDPPSGAGRLAARQALGLLPGTPVVGTVARFDPVKDLGTLLSAFAALRRRRREAVLVLVGDGPERAALEATVAARGLAASVRFTGLRRDARALLPAFDVFVNCSTSEGISLTILEAMAASRPVVATAVGGTPEIVEDGRTGRLVASRHAEALTAALDEMLASETRAAGMGTAGRARVLEAFTQDRMMREYLALYQALGPRA